MACVRPLVLAVDGESRRLVEKAGAGFVVPPESAEEMADAIRRMAGLSQEERDAMGLRGRTYGLENFHRREQADRFADLVLSLAGQGDGTVNSAAS